MFTPPIVTSALRPAWKMSVTAIRPASPGKRARRVKGGRLGEAAGTTSFRSLVGAGNHGAGNHGAGNHGAGNHGAGEHGQPADANATAAGWPGLSPRDVVVAGPPCGDGQAYTSLLDLTLLTGATLVAAPVPLVTAAMRVYQGTAAIVPRGTDVAGLAADRVFAIE